MSLNKNISLIYILAFNLFALYSCSNLEKHKNAKLNKAILYYSNGTENLINKNYTQALKSLLQANELKPNDSKILNNLGMTYFFKNKLDHAIDFLTKSIDSDPKNSDARNNLASIYFRENKLDEAKFQYNLVKNDLVYPHQYRTYYNLALIAEKESDYPTMLKLLNLSINDRDNYCPVHFKLGKFNFKKKKYATALKNFKNASKGTCYNYAAPIFYQGLVWRNLQENEKAIAKFNELIDIFPKSEFVKIAQKHIVELKKNTPNIVLRSDLKPRLPKKIKSLEF